MMRFVVDGRDGGSFYGNSCNDRCCCQEANAVPGETNKWFIEYYPWVSNIGGRGLVQPVLITFDRLTVDPPPPFPTNLPPTSIDYYFGTPFNTPLNGDVSVSANDPESAPMTFAIVPNTGPSHGTIVFNPSGTFTYVPVTGWTGYDQFAYTVSDGVNTPVRYTVVIGTDPNGGPPLPPTTPLPVPILNVPPNRIYVNQHYIEFPLVVAPDAVVGDVYRMHVTATAMDCEGDTFTHKSCYDVRITKC